MRASIRAVVAVSWVSLAGAGCGGGAHRNEAKAPSASVATAAAQCGVRSVASPVGRSDAGSTVALAKIGARTVAFVADEDAKSILTVDVERRAQLAETPLGARPAQLLVARDGRVLVALRDTNELVAFGASKADAPLTRGCAVATAVEPVAIASTPDGATVLVASGWGQRLTAFDATTLAPRFSARVPREPRAIVVSDDGATAFVSHAVGATMSLVDLADAKHAVTPLAMRGNDARERLSLGALKKQRGRLARGGPSVAADVPLGEMEERLKKGKPTCQGFALAKSSAVPGRVFAPQVIVDPGDPERRPDGYGDNQAPTEAPDIGVIDESAKQVLPSSVSRAPEIRWGRASRDTRDEAPECLLPRAAAVDDKSKSLLVACFGIDAVVAYDATSADPQGAERRRWIVGSGPSGVAIDVERSLAVVWSQFDRTISTFSVGDMSLVDEKTSAPKVARTEMPALADKLPAEYALGRILFHAAGDARIAADGRACASCHPDGRDDGITWATPEGPRRTILLAGRVGATAPYAWDGKGSTLPAHLGNTFDRLSGRGLRSIELDALVHFVTHMPVPRVAAVADAAKVERGRQIFASREAGCASCHAGDMYTDGKTHDVGSKDKFDRGASFNTPSLRMIGGTGPYFHDGRYATLTELLRKSDGSMGHTSHLNANDLDALESFLRTL